MSLLSKLPPRVSFSQIQTFNQCRFKFYLSYIKKLYVKTSAVGLMRGSILHEAYDAYLFNGRSVEAAYQKLDFMHQKYIDEGADSVQTENVADEATKTLQYYLPWAAKNDDFDVVIPYRGQTQCETSGQVDLSLPDGSKVPLFFKIDAIIMKNNRMMLMEHKFRKNLDANGLEHDLQIAMYHAAWNKLVPEHSLDGTLYNIVSAKPRKADGVIAIRSYVYRGEIENLRTLRNVGAAVYEMQRAAKDEHGVWPMNPTTDCSWSCQFVGMCLAVRSGASIQEFVASGQYHVRDETSRSADYDKTPLELSPHVVERL